MVKLILLIKLYRYYINIILQKLEVNIMQYFKKRRKRVI